MNGMGGVGFLKKLLLGRVSEDYCCVKGEDLDLSNCTLTELYESFFIVIVVFDMMHYFANFLASNTCAFLLHIFSQSVNPP